MRVIKRAAALAYAFVSINYDQATAFKYLLRPAGGEQGAVRARQVVHTARGSWGGSMAKLTFLFVATMGVVAVSGVPTAEAATISTFGVLRGMLASIWMTPGAALGGSLDGAARWAESGSLLLLATGFFGLAFILRRRVR